MKHAVTIEVVIKNRYVYATMLFGTRKGLEIYLEALQDVLNTKEDVTLKYEIIR
jgi:hypothetical protein